MESNEEASNEEPTPNFLIEIPEGAAGDVTTEVFYTSEEIPVLIDDSEDAGQFQLSSEYQIAIPATTASISLIKNTPKLPQVPKNLLKTTPFQRSMKAKPRIVSKPIKAWDLPTLKVCLSPVSVSQIDSTPAKKLKLNAAAATNVSSPKEKLSSSKLTQKLKAKPLEPPEIVEEEAAEPINLPNESAPASTAVAKRAFADDVAGKCFVLDCVVRKKPSMDVRNRKLPMSFSGFERGRQWLTNAGRTDLLTRYAADPNSMRHYSICDLHFADNQFMNPLRRLTIPNAIPTLFGKDTVPYSYYVLKQKEGLDWYERTMKQSRVVSTPLNSKSLPRPLATPLKPTFFVNQDADNFANILSNALLTQAFTDSVLACPGLKLRIHKAVLAAGSPYFRNLLSEPPFAEMDEPCIILEDFTPWELQILVYYMYHGTISIPHEKVAEVRKFLAKFQIGQGDLPPAPPIYKDCLDMAIKVTETYTLPAPALPFKSSRRKIYGYANLDRNPSSSPRLNYTFLEKLVVKSPGTQKIQTYKPKMRVDFSLEEVLEEEEEDFEPESLFNAVREAEHPVPSLELDFQVLDQHDTYEPGPELSAWDQKYALVGENYPTNGDITVDELEVGSLLEQIYNFEYVSPYITALIRKGYPSKRLGNKIHLLTNAPVAKHSLSKGSNKEKLMLQARKKAEQRKAQNALKKALKSVAKGKQKLLKRSKLASTSKSIGGDEAEGDLEVEVLGESDGPRRKKNYKVINGFICEFCGKTFNYRANLIAHLRIHRGEFPYRCETCGKGFRMKKVLRVHEDGHMGIRNFKCDLCDRRFLRKDQMAKHRRVHTGEKPYICHICGKRFRVKGGLNNHVRTHTKEKPFSCQICNMNFSSHKTVNEHRENHSQDDRTKRDPTFFYKCENCCYYFCRPSQVMKHNCESRGADNEGDFWCQRCPKRFVSEECAQQHYDQAHLKKSKHHPKEETCQTCNISFVSLGDLLKHAKDLHIGQKEAEVYCNADGLYPCQTCDAVSETEELWREHRKNHEEVREPAGCTTCGKMFKSKAALNRHSITHMEVKPHMCTMCEKSFTTKQMLTNHMNSHLKLKPYVCEWCGHAFSSQGNYYKHKYRHLGVRKCKYCHRIFDTNKKLHEHEAAHEAGKVMGNMRKQQLDVVVVPETVEAESSAESVEEDDASNYYVVLNSETLYKTA